MGGNIPGYVILLIMKISNWGNYPVTEGQEFSPKSQIEITQIVKALPSCIARGNGRSYGDASLHENVISSLHLNKILGFDKNVGLVKCEAGVLLGDILKAIVPHGYFLPVVTGTKLVSLGGAIAADVHGKNHSGAGTIAKYITRFEILTADGKTRECSATKNKDLFWASFGAMGLTGYILNASISLIKIETAYIDQESIKTDNLADTIQLFKESREWDYQVAWLDTGQEGVKLGRSIFIRGRHASIEQLKSDRKKSSPLDLKKTRKLEIPERFPSRLMNSISLKAFNALYYHKQRAPHRSQISTYEDFFFPLDRLKEWNRLYGKNGFMQYQVVVPFAFSAIAIGEMFNKIQLSKQHCNLAILKSFGEENEHSPLSFPMPGHAIAMDFKRNDKTQHLFNLLDEIAANYGGRSYLAKDARMNSTFFKQSYPRLSQLTTVLNRYNKSGKFRSLQSDRLGITP